jgi:peroxiredoxin Q/BCP
MLEGQPAPQFRLEGSDGKLHTLNDYLGKILVLFFYPKDGTSGCTSEAIGFRDLHAQLLQLGAVPVGISRDSLKAHAKFTADYQLPYALLSDPDASVLTAYGAFGEKVQCGKKSMGTIRSTVVISPEGTVIRHWTKVAKASEHPAQVLEFLKGLTRE